jgi:hypothetical protein
MRFCGELHELGRRICNRSIFISQLATRLLILSISMIDTSDPDLHDPLYAPPTLVVGRLHWYLTRAASQLAGGVMKDTKIPGRRRSIP